MFYILFFSTFLFTYQLEITAQPLPDAMLIKTSNAFNNVAAIAKPAVVSISSIKTVQTYRSSPFFNDPYFDFYYDNYNGSKQREGLGSGVIVSKYGHILTNHHVVQGADEISVTLHSGKEFNAELIGTDKKTDLAILKITGNSLPFVKLGDSDSILVGDWAIAVGNPFGLAGTVTAGIISAKGRSGVIDVDNYADFIQTDAAINPGNSGGALLNIRGELIGINTAIFSQSGGYMGIGFAIPVNMAKRVMEDIIKYGHVRRGMLGVTVQPITDEVIDKFNLKTNQGALIIEVKPGSAAAIAGIKKGDLIIELNGKQVTDYLTLRSRISELKLNEKSYCVLMRNGKKQKIYFTLTSSLYDNKKPFKNTFGLNVASLNNSLKKRYRIPNSISGVIITSVKPGSIAAKYRLKKGHIITEINNQPFDSVSDFETLLENKKSVLLSIYEDGFTFVVLLQKK